MQAAKLLQLIKKIILFFSIHQSLLTQTKEGVLNSKVWGKGNMKLNWNFRVQK